MTSQASSTFAAVTIPSAASPLRRRRNVSTVVRANEPRAGIRLSAAHALRVCGDVRVNLHSAEPSDKSVEIMRKFSEQYARRSGTYFCMDKGVTSVVIKGLADHKDSLGAPLCPCRHYDDKPAEAAQGFWNCPCVPMRERKECHCMLFLTPENDFAGQEQSITLEEIKESTANM